MTVRLWCGGRQGYGVRLWCECGMVGWETGVVRDHGVLGDHGMV